MYVGLTASTRQSVNPLNCVCGRNSGGRGGIIQADRPF